VIVGMPQSLQATLEAALLLQLLQRRVGLLADPGGQPLQVARSEGRGGPPRCGSGASVPVARRRWSRRTINEVLTRKIRASQRIEPS
jgi:hypothetical protein